MTLSIENPKDTIRKLLEFINEFDKVAGYKINAQKYRGHLYTNNEISEREINETVSFTIISKRTQHLRINLPKETKNYSLKTKKTMKEVKDDTNRCKNTPCPWTGRILPK